jgi:hypothetical protein
MKTSFLNGTLIITAAILVLASCQNSSTNTSVNDSTKVADTMPVLKPPIQESSGIIHTPPIHDSNAIMPDSAIK